MFNMFLFIILKLLLVGGLTLPYYYCVAEPLLRALPPILRCAAEGVQCWLLLRSRLVNGGLQAAQQYSEGALVYFVLSFYYLSLII